MAKIYLLSLCQVPTHPPLPPLFASLPLRPTHTLGYAILSSASGCESDDCDRSVSDTSVLTSPGPPCRSFCSLSSISFLLVIGGSCAGAGAGAATGSFLAPGAGITDGLGGAGASFLTASTGGAAFFSSTLGAGGASSFLAAGAGAGAGAGGSSFLAIGAGATASFLITCGAAGGAGGSSFLASGAGAGGGFFFSPGPSSESGSSILPIGAGAGCATGALALVGVATAFLTVFCTAGVDPGGVGGAGGWGDSSTEAA
mmetsp:Transcript_28098/g.70180  ORF Transcript_28098/g.70180 Transcript_28098/m.70180 type:complete len:257 (-) Transcript_28098:493-1263(-)